MHPVFQYSKKLPMAEALIAVQVEDLEDGVQDIVWELLSSCHLHSSLKLRYKAKQETAINQVN